MPAAPSTPRNRATFLRLVGFLRPYKASMVISVVLAIGSQCAALAAILLTRSVVNVLRHDQLNRLPWLVGLVVALGLTRALMMSGRRLIAGKQALLVELDMRTGIYAKLVRLSFGFYDRHQTGQLMSRATVDLQGVRFFLGYGLIFFFQHVFTIIGVGILVFLISWKLALIAMAIAPVLVAVAYRYSHVSHPLLRDVQQKMADVATVAEENIVGVHVVKSFAQEDAELAKFSRSSEAVFGLSVQANRQRAFYIPILSFLPLLAQAAILLVGGRMVVRGTLSLGDFVVFNLFLALLVMPLRQLGMWIGQAQRATASGERIFQVIDEPEEIRDAPDARELPPGPGLLAFEHVTFGYDPEHPVLHDLDLELAAGRIVALIGHTGAGKTTVASLVPRFYDVQGGRVSIDGNDVRELTLTSLRSEIGVIAQDPFLFSATVHENIAFGRPGATREEVERAARLAQAHDFIAALPDGYDTVIGERGITLSGGQRQRVAIARALVVDPRVLILDDATASVDATTESKIRDGLREAMRGRTTIIIAHRLSTIALADEVVVLEDGRIAARGTHDDLVDSNEVYREIYEHGLLERVFTEEVV
ncbi:MAG: ABC transporter ATP-binding protein/permease [Actinomycetota bacterium]|nr:ABC transporter ATP-binding protein/permease [Actinomycetota bacterium]